MPGKGGRKIPYPGETLYKKLKRKGFNVRYEPKMDTRAVELATDPTAFGEDLVDQPKVKAGNRRLGEILTAKFPRASLRRAKRELHPGERATVGELTARSAIKTSNRMTRDRDYWTVATDFSKQYDKIKDRYKKRNLKLMAKKKGLLGIGLTAASLGSSIREAQKK